MARKIVIEGIHPYGLHFAELLIDIRKDNVFILDEDKDLCNAASAKLDAMILNGRVEDRVLDECGKEFDVFIATRSDDGKNLLSCLYVKDNYKVDKILSILQDDKEKKSFINQGILTVNPEKAISKILFRYMDGDPKLTDIITMSGQNELFIFEIKTQDELGKDKVSLVNKKISSLDLDDYNIVCVRMEKDGKVIRAKPDYILNAGDILQLSINPKYHKKLQKYK